MKTKRSWDRRLAEAVEEMLKTFSAVIYFLSMIISIIVYFFIGIKLAENGAPGGVIVIVFLSGLTQVVASVIAIIALNRINLLKKED